MAAVSSTDRLSDYIISLTNLYGLIHKDKVAEIYNLHHEEKVDAAVVEGLLKSPSPELAENSVRTNDDYFAHRQIMEQGSFDQQLVMRYSIPFYIPEQDELLKYRDESYFEVNEQYRELFSYIMENSSTMDEDATQALCVDIREVCRSEFSPKRIFELFEASDVDFKEGVEVNQLLDLVIELANHTRIWENNGHTPEEVLLKYEKPHLKPFPAGVSPDAMGNMPHLTGVPGGKSRKPGRNDPCPCGSGKKYKKCCLGKA
ncbi:MAG: hypothetical protein HQP61_10175 [Peptococcaceae bacterium]|nr:hypothetical protein [Candidatus Syntrophopropionicum ammoniitolerans]